ncbi:sugar O-acetyltransferase [Cellulomonas endophytica]|uniref:sugar O-acetyltransferase n=1 Tax=Cellulomonas endophytica TaxID=2494735 RepID=UPI0010137AA4|nr:sugar O-acetyltransferase [Cellulomonas endophytica]
MDEREPEVRRRIAAQELYTDSGAGLEGLEESRVRGKELAREFNGLEPRDVARRDAVLRELFGAVGTGTWVEPPLHVAYGVHTTLGEGVYVNFGLTLVDDGPVHIGDRVMLAPHVTITSTGHPVHPALRPHGEQFSAPVTLEADVWVGANVTILPGVTIGEGSVVAAGSVVTADVPPMCVVGGVPARILRRITDADLDWTYRPPRTLA